MAVAVAACLVSSACGNGSKSDIPASATTAPPTTSTIVEVPTLSASVLQLTDLPTGWSARPHTGGDTTNVCYGDVPKPITKAYSDDFSRGDFAASSSAALFADEAQARVVIARPRAPEVADCLRQQVQSAIAPQATGEVVDVTLVGIPTVSYGDDSFALRGTITVTPRTGVKSMYYIDTLFVRIGRAGAVFQLSGTAPALDTSTPNPLIALVLARLRSVLAASVTTPTTTAGSPGR